MGEAGVFLPTPLARSHIAVAGPASVGDSVPGLL